MHDGSSAFLPERSIFLYFGAFKTETLQIYSLIGQTLKQLFPSVPVPSEKYSPCHFTAR